MLAVFTLSSTGFNICSHTCRHSGNTDYTLLLSHTTETCCGADVKAKSCCDDKDTYFKLDVVKKVEDDTRLLPQKFLAVFAVLLPDYLVVSTPVRVTALVSHSPPAIPARTLLNLVQVFRL